ncbi:MAG TPA: hypothetical protein VNN74_08410 [Candidatus Micrarchaeia archaeon]|nr:hypothetical protein [Candidatus Micrarchaeia archaeon]
MLPWGTPSRPAAAAIAVAGPIERAVLAIAAARRAALFRRRPRRGPHQRLVESDVLMEQVERCRLEECPLVPGGVFAEVVQLLAAVDPALRQRLGSNRHPDHVAALLFETQAGLMESARRRRDGRPAEIVQLFPG